MAQSFAERDPYEDFRETLKAYLSPEERANKEETGVKSLSESFYNHLSQQRVRVSDMQAQLDKYKTKRTPVDLAPLASFADFLNQGKSKVFDRTMAMQGQEEMRLRQMESDVNRAQNQLTQQELNALQSQLKAQRTGVDIKFLNTMLRQSKSQQDFGFKVEKFIGEEIEKPGEKFREDSTTASMVETALQPIANPKTGEMGVSLQAWKSMASPFARFVSGEKGVLTEKDVGRAILPIAQQTVAGLINWIGNVKDAWIPAKYVKEMQKLMVIARARKAEKRIEELDRVYGNLGAMPTVQRSGLLEPGGFGQTSFQSLRSDISQTHPNYDASTGSFLPYEAAALPPEDLDAELQELIKSRGK